jgi:hypothetical protein
VVHCSRDGAGLLGQESGDMAEGKFGGVEWGVGKEEGGEGQKRGTT